MRLRIDNREPSQLKDLFKNATFACEFTNLKAGDFEFVNITGNVVLLIERKDVDDLSSSLTDGRFDEQKTKLSLACSGDSPFPIAYLIEGEYIGHKKQAAIETIILTTPFRDGFFVLHSATVRDTFDIIVRIMDLYEKGEMNPLTEDELHRRFISCRAAHRGGGGQFSKKDEWWTISLAQIPGIGPQAARAISSAYPTAGQLITAYGLCANDDKRAKMLQDLKMGARRIGIKASEKVWETVMGNQKTESIKVEKLVAKKVSAVRAKKEDVCLFDSD